MLSMTSVGETSPQAKFGGQKYSPGGLVGSTFTFDDDEMLHSAEFDEEITLGPEFFVFEEKLDEQMGSGRIKEEYLPLLNNRYSIYSQNLNERETQIDFTSFLERLDSSLDKELMQLIAKYFHNNITVYRNNKKIFDIFEDYSARTLTPIGTSNDEISLGTQLVVTIDLENRESPQIVKDFIEEADELLDTRDDLKLALRAVFPPTIAAEGFIDPIFSSPLSRTSTKKRKSRLSRSSTAFKTLNDLDTRNNSYRKRGRPRKSSLDVLSEPKKSRKRKEGNDDEWRPEKKRVKNSKNKADDTKKVNKVKTPSDKAKEEADLASMGIEKLEEHILTLQQQMRNVKHKHRKGTICPRCTTEQRLKLAFKAKNRAQCEIKVQARTPVQGTKVEVTPLVHSVVAVPKSVRRKDTMTNITPPVTRPKSSISIVEKATKLAMEEEA